MDPRSTKGKQLRSARNDSELKTAAKHVTYEIAMLAYSAMELAPVCLSPLTTPAEYPQNMAMESFLLHFRNLRAFLCPSSQRVGDDDVLAVDFLPGCTGMDVGDVNRLAADKQLLDRMLAHLSYSREEYITGGRGGWRIAEMAVLLFDEFDRFLVRVPPRMTPWLPSQAQIAEWRSKLKERFPGDLSQYRGYTGPPDSTVNP